MQNKPLKKILVFEFVTGGGLVNQPLPVSLAKEGMLMREALLSDMSELDDWEVYTSYDVRLSQPKATFSYPIANQHDYDALWQYKLENVDYVWLIAPETNGVLLLLSQRVLAQGKKLIGPGLNAIEMTSSKYETAKYLASYGLPIIQTDYFSEWFNQLECHQALPETKWLVKPDDGAGCEETYLFSHYDALIDWFEDYQERQESHIIQKYIHGIACSLSILNYQNESVILACNLQQICCQNNQLSYKGGVVNGADIDHHASLALVQKLSASLPDLQGYFGVDLIIHPDNNQDITLVEVNPRITTSYIFLKQSLGLNPAYLILNRLFSEGFSLPQLHKNPVTFQLND